MPGGQAGGDTSLKIAFSEKTLDELLAAGLERASTGADFKSGTAVPRKDANYAVSGDTIIIPQDVDGSTKSAFALALVESGTKDRTFHDGLRAAGWQYNPSMGNHFKV